MDRGEIVKVKLHGGATAQRRRSLVCACAAALSAAMTAARLPGKTELPPRTVTALPGRAADANGGGLRRPLPAPASGDGRTTELVRSMPLHGRATAAASAAGMCGLTTRSGGGAGGCGSCVSSVGGSGSGGGGDGGVGGSSRGGRGCCGSGGGGGGGSALSATAVGLRADGRLTSAGSLRLAVASGASAGPTQACGGYVVGLAVSRRCAPLCCSSSHLPASA